MRLTPFRRQVAGEGPVEKDGEKSV